MGSPTVTTSTTAPRLGYATLPPAYAEHGARVLADVAAGRRPTACPPLAYATARTPSNRTAGRQAGGIARLLGEPFMPAQQLIADVALELDPDRPGAWRYQLVVVSLPRQAGKTSLMRAVRVHRAIMRPNLTALMTAQTGKDARKQWSKLAERVTAPDSPLRPFAHIRRSIGSEALAFVNGSRIAPFAPTPKSVHGDTVPLVDVDEGWSFGTEDGHALIEAIDPTQITVRDRQLWIFSTMGTAASTFFHELVDQGREAVSDPRSRMAYFECSAPDGADPLDPLTVASFHPAVGHTQRLDDLMVKARGNPAVWRRSYLNQRTATSGPAVVDLAEWDTLQAARELPPADELVLAYAVAADRSGATIAAAWRAGFADDGRPVVHVAVVASQAGAAWLPRTVEELRRRLRPRTVGADDGGVTRNATTELRRLAGTDDVVRALTVREYAEACAELLGAVQDGRLTHDGAAQLRDALPAAVMRPMGGARGFDPRASSGPIDALQAATVAAWLALDDATPTVQLFA